MLGDISVRLMVERPDLAAATADALKLIKTIVAFGRPAGLQVKAYWKIAAYFEIAVTLRGANAGHSLRRVADALAPEWDWLPQTAIWDYRKHGGFKVRSLARSARWAEISLLRERKAAKPKPARRGKKKRKMPVRSSRKARRRIS